MPIRSALLAVFLFGSSLGLAQTTIIPQIADGGGWQTTLVLTNTGTTSATLAMSFFQSTSNGQTESWTPSFLETSSPQSVTLAAASTTFLHTPGTASLLTEGWAQLEASSSVVAYAIFTQTVPGRTNQDGTAPAAAGSGHILAPFDNTSGFVTTMAIANPGASSETVSVSAQPNGATPASLASINLPAGGYMAFTLPQQFPTLGSTNGLLEFYSSSGTFSIIAIRFNPTGGFTASPVYLESGGPVISSQNFNGTYTGTYSGAGVTGDVDATVNNGIMSVTNPGSGSGTISASGQITFGIELNEGATCSFTGTFTLSGSSASASGTFSCTNPSFSGTWSLTRLSS